MRKCIVGLASLLVLWTSAKGAEMVTVSRTRCAVHDTLVTGEPGVAPSFSWQVTALTRGWYQAAYQVQVASTATALRDGSADLWDSGRVGSGESLHVPYAGKSLKSARGVYWRVRVWGRDGSGTEFSAPQRFDTGLLAPGDWQGSQWIGLERPLVVHEQEKAGAKKVASRNGYHSGLGEAVNTRDVDSENKWVMVDLGESLRFDRVQLYPAVPYDYKPRTPGFGFPVRFRIEASDSPAFLDARVVCDKTGAPFPNPGETIVTFESEPIQARYIRVTATELWKPKPGSPGFFALDELKVFAGKTNLAQGKNVSALDAIESGGWKTANLTDGLHVIPDPDAQAESEEATPEESAILAEPMPAGPHAAAMLRRDFQLAAKVRRATAYVCGLGYHELYLNGRKVGDQVLDPGKTEYDKQALYVIHDVTDYLVSGNNVVGVILGGGWYDMPTKDVWGWHKARWRGAPRVMLRLVMELKNGQVMDLVSDPDWKVTDRGPIVFNSVRSGETYDARREMPGWAKAGFDAAHWKPVDILKAPGGRLVRQNLPPIKEVETVPVREITEPTQGVRVFHLGQNFAGWIRLKVSGPAGTRVRLRYGERLGKDGRLETGAIDKYTHGRFQTDEYVLKGEGVEEWSPRFCYHAFRYVEVTGLPGAPTKDTLEGRAVHSAVDPVGTFSCSSDVINQVQNACVWTLRSNIHSIPQDCPHREKLGWMADGLAAARQGVYNFDMEAFYAKWIADMRAAQDPKGGALPGIVPCVGWSWYFEPCWNGACVLLPWRMYQQYGDRRFLSENFVMMKAFTDGLAARAKDHIISAGQWGDWMGTSPGPTPRPVTGTAYYYQFARIVSESAAILGDKENASRYAALAEDIKVAFLDELFDATTGRFKSEMQTTYGLALALGLVPDAQRKAVQDRFAELVATRDRSHIQAGIVGTPYILQTLTDMGRADLVCAMVSQTDHPGWFAMTADGKNTIDEKWDGQESLNHPAFSCVSAWFYEGLAGIRPDPRAPGFERFFVEPNVVGDLTHAKASYDSAYGLIRSEWTRDVDGLRFVVDVPANTTATVILPCGDPDKVTESGHALSDVQGLRVLKVEAGKLRLEVGSGRYAFAVRSIIR